jgi:hypothetical protein
MRHHSDAAAWEVQRAVGITHVPYDPSVETPDEGGTNGRLTGLNPYASQGQPSAAGCL